MCIRQDRYFACLEYVLTDYEQAEQPLIVVVDEQSAGCDDTKLQRFLESFLKRQVWQELDIEDGFTYNRKLKSAHRKHEDTSCSLGPHTVVLEKLSLDLLVRFASKVLQRAFPLICYGAVQDSLQIVSKLPEYSQKQLV